MTAQDHDLFALGDIPLQSGEILRDAKLAYKTYGDPANAANGTVLMPTFYTGTHGRNEGFFGTGRGIDPSRHFIVSVNLFGNGLSTSPSNTVPAQHGAAFPDITYHDNIACQHRLITEHLGLDHIHLVTGWSMAGAQCYHWAAQYPDRVGAILPFCASAKTSPHNFVFLEGVKATLCADQNWNAGNYEAQPEAGLRAFGRVYAGWAFSQTFYREHLYRKLGFETVEDLLVDWEEDHVRNWDANNLLVKLKTWQTGDISANDTYNGDFMAALQAIQAKAILIPCSDDLYFPPADNAIEAKHIPNAELRVYNSPWGHCVASPGNDPAFATFLDDAIQDLLPG